MTEIEEIKQELKEIKQRLEYYDTMFNIQWTPEGYTVPPHNHYINNFNETRPINFYQNTKDYQPWMKGEK